MKISKKSSSSNYVDKLIASMKADVDGKKVKVDDIRCEVDEDNIYATITRGKSVEELEVPIKDLSMIDIDEDKDYIFGYLDDEDDDDWELKDTKEVDWMESVDSYNMWYSPSRDLYVFTLGDPDFKPEEGYWDWEADSYETAVEWFDDWGNEDDWDEDEQIYSPRGVGLDVDDEYDDEDEVYEPEYDDDPLFSSTQITSSDGIFTGDEIFEWVTDHPEIEKEALEDFNVESLKDVKCSELSDWVFSSTDIADKAMKDLGKRNDEEA